MEQFTTVILPYILSGISVGGQYALIAIGYTMVYGIPVSYTHLTLPTKRIV